VEQRPLIRLGARGFWAIALTLFVVAYNVSVLPAIMPAIVRDFQSSIGFIQSVLVLFSLVTASFAPTAENLCRYFGRTTVFLTSLVVYGVGIVATALSPSMGALAASFVVLTGLGAASLVSTPWTIADLAYGGKLDARAAVALTVATSVGNGAGALLGGLLASGIGWRWSFAPSLLVLIFVFAFARALPKLGVRTEQPIDWAGGLLSFFGFGSILLGVSLAGEFGWWEPRREFAVAGVVLPPFAISIVPTLIAAGAIALGLFIFWQRLQANHRRASLLRVGLLRKPAFVRGTLTAMLHTLVATGVQFNLYQFLPVAVALNPFRTALTVIPYPATVTLVAVGSKFLRLGERIAPKSIVTAGLALFGAGIAMIYSRLHVGVSSLDLLPGLVVMGAGSGLFLSSIGDLAYAAASQEEKPEGSAIYNPVLNLGNSLGRAIMGTLLVFATSRGIVDGISQHLGQTLPARERTDLIFQLQEMIQTLPRADVVAAVLGRLPPPIQPVVYSIELQAATYGLRASLLLALVLTALCLLLARTLVPFPSRTASR
jgi:MFS family permease